jgi:hypothetical protein
MPQYQPTAGALFIFDSYKMAAITKIDNKVAFQAAILCGVVSIVLSISLYVTVGNTFGLSKIPYTNGGGTDLFYVGMPSFVNVKPAAIAWWPWSLAGLITAVVLTTLSQSLVWWPLHPIGIYLATCRPLWYPGYWSNCAIAYVIKQGIIKTGGIKTYEEWLLPILTGFLVGYTFVSVVGGLVGAYRFIVPF